MTGSKVMVLVAVLASRPVTSARKHSRFSRIFQVKLLIFHLTANTHSEEDR
jgi:hypothetical protein